MSTLPVANARRMGKANGRIYHQPGQVKKMRILKKIVIAMAVLLGLYSVAGFVLIPIILETVLPDKLGQFLNRPVRVGVIAFNPFALDFRVDALDIREKNGVDPFVAFDTLFVHLNANSILKQGLIIQEARLDKPVAHLARVDANTFNFSDLTKAETSEKDKPEASGRPFRFALRNLRITDGSLFFRDEPIKKNHAISQLNFSLPLISNFEEDAATDAAATLTAVINHAKVSVDAKTLPFHEPLDARINLALAGAKIPYYFDYVPKDMTGVDIASGSLDARAQIHFLQAKKGRNLTVQGDITVVDLNLKDRAGASILTLSRLTAALAPSRILEREVRLSSVKLEKPSLFVNRNKEDDVNLTTLGPKPSAVPAASAEPAKKPTASEKPFLLLVDTFLLDSGKVMFVDHGAASAEPDAKPHEIDIDNLNIAINNFSLEPGKTIGFDVKTQVNRNANISSSGRMTLTPLFVESEFKIADINFAWFHPYIPENIRLKIKDGRFFADGAASVNQTPEGLVNASLKGRVAVNDPASQGTLPAETGNAKADNPDAGHAVDLAAKSGPAADPLVVVLDDLNASISDFSMEPGKVARFDIKTRLNREADISASGQLGMAPLSLESDFTVANFPVMWVQSYIPENVQFKIRDGRFSADGGVSVGLTPEDKVAATVKGALAVNDFVSENSGTGKPFTSWGDFSIKGLNIDTHPLRINMDQILLKKPKFAMVLYNDGTSSATSIIKPAKSPAPESSAGKTAASEPSSPFPPITAGEVILEHGDFKFTDQTIDPDFSTRLRLNQLRVTGLTSENFTSATVKADGIIDNDAPVKISGVINPMKDQMFIDLTAEVSNMELSPLSPYSGKFIGQVIGKGKLTTYLAVKLDGEKLKAQNRLVLDQLTLGRKVNSSEALDLPVGLAISLLKDRSGKIDVDLPISGRTDDPKFGIFKTILEAFKKLIVKAAASPFDLVGGIVGGGAELQYIEFEPGIAEINETGSKKLSAVATLMFERPGLKMDMTGYVDKEKDREGLAAASVDRELKTLKAKDAYNSRASRPKPEDIELTPAEYAQYVKELYAERAGEDYDKSLPIPEMAAYLNALVPVSEQDLRKLSVARALQVKSAILKDSRIAGDRLFLNEAKALTPKKIKTFSAARVELGLK